ncbi:hypothetical protein AMECASPLE_014205 [Ameca splendens]|uniref:Uncharacterized protein n=1 Tax=Ameca splendens TaxID=208324 RepID=A0ABV0YDE5_9TELE
MNRQAVDQHLYEFVVWHHQHVHKSTNFSYPFSAPRSKLLFHHSDYFKVQTSMEVNFLRVFFPFTNLTPRVIHVSAKEMKSFKAALRVKRSPCLSPDKTPVTRMPSSVTGVIHETARSSQMRG